MEKYILTIDEGTTSTRTLVVDKKGKIISSSQREFTQFFPKSGWVEHDAQEIWGTQLSTIREALKDAHISENDIASIGITNQRETVVLWNKKTGLPVYKAIVWQDARTSKYCEELVKKDKNINKKINEKTGLLINPYFSATKIKWILENVDDAKEALAEGNLLAGTIDSWLIWKITDGKVHATDVSNASRTLLYNIRTNEWDQELLDLFNIPREILPVVNPSSSTKYGFASSKIFSDSSVAEIPISGVIGDQQSALFGQLAINEGDVKNTYGTGNFVLVNTGEKAVPSKNNLLTTIAWQIGEGKTVYALEGSVFIAGSALQFLRDGLRLILDAKLADVIVSLVSENDDQEVFFVPALAGLGAPYWDSTARGMIIGLERGTRREHIVKATLEAIAYQSNDLISMMSKDMNKEITKMRVDGGASNSNYLMQFQSSISNTRVERPKNIETTAMGAAYMAGLAVGFWSSIKELEEIFESDRIFKPEMKEDKRKYLIEKWDDAIDRSRNWKKS
ncbi:MAG: glycerol kinase GlpK [Mycoplasma sp.]|nr:glycerol kinase GlpK [Mycoplasma sp.]